MRRARLWITLWGTCHQQGHKQGTNCREQWQEQHILEINLLNINNLQKHKERVHGFTRRWDALWFLCITWRIRRCQGLWQAKNVLGFSLGLAVGQASLARLRQICQEYGSLPRFLWITLLISIGERR